VPHILLTGFTPFPGVDLNPTALLVEDFAAHPPPGLRLSTEVLPTAFEPAGERIRQLIAQHQPEAVLMLGVAAIREAINLERVGYNWDEAPKPDIQGVSRAGQPIRPDGPPCYGSTLPLEAMHAALESAGIPVTYSDDPGRYVCNHVLYQAADALAGSGIPFGFIHVSALKTAPESPGMEYAVMREAVRLCLEVLREFGRADMRAQRP
jgi:pyroglutamyl-peptidase